MSLAVKDVVKKFGGVKALDQCSFSIKKGKITALIGPNGSGKSTMFNVISRLEKENSGSVKFGGKNVSFVKDYNVAKLGISRTFQQVRLFHNLTIEEHLEIALQQEDERLWKSLTRKEEKNSKKIKEILELVGLDKSVGTYATDLSYGQRKLLDLAIAIAKPHTLLMLDEPVAGINPALRKEIKEILRSLNEKGETILLIEHDMNFVMGLAHEVFVLDQGKIIASGDPETVRNNKRVLEAYLGE